MSIASSTRWRRWWATSSSWRATARRTAEEDDVRLDVLVAEAVERAERNRGDVRFALVSQPTLVRGVPARLDRAVTNLLDNAAKWSPPG